MKSWVRSFVGAAGGAVVISLLVVVSVQESGSTEVGAIRDFVRRVQDTISQL